ncbi:MAG: hypothetical protein II611_07865, partial [Treponema sp.]|nr:hypothetical protein [Treponema sp.]
YRQTPFTDVKLSKKDIYREWGKLHKDSEDVGELKYAIKKFKEGKDLGDADCAKFFDFVSEKIKKIDEAKNKHLEVAQSSLAGGEVRGMLAGHEISVPNSGDLNGTCRVDGRKTDIAGVVKELPADYQNAIIIKIDKR